MKDALLTLKQWTPFVFRTAYYGTISLTLGPWTRDRRASLWAMKRWSMTSANGLGLRISASFSPEFQAMPESAPAVYASNHLSAIDILVLGACLPGDFKWAAKSSLLKVPFLGWHLRLAGHVPVDRTGNAGARRRALEGFEGVLRANKRLLIFPEGTRSEDGNLKPFRPGGFMAAVRGEAPVVPVALSGTHAMMKTGRRTANTQIPVTVRVGAPLWPDPALSNAEAARELSQRARAEIAKMLGEPQP